MRHNKKGRKLGTDYSHTKAMKRSLVSALFLNDRIKTVESRAKEIRPQVDKVITWAKRGDLHSRRLAIAYLNDKELVREIFEKVAQGMFQDRPGGYTRIMKLGPRKGDNAPMVIMELVTEPCVPKAERKVQRDGAALAVRRARLGRRVLGVYPNQAPQQVQDPLVTLLLIRAARAWHIYSPSFWAKSVRQASAPEGSPSLRGVKTSSQISSPRPIWFSKCRLTPAQSARAKSL